MNLVEVYITKIHSYEEKETAEGDKYIEAIIDQDCYGNKKVKHQNIFTLSDWEQIQAEGFYLG